jgi:hypothetical protein
VTRILVAKRPTVKGTSWVAVELGPSANQCPSLTIAGLGNCAGESMEKAHVEP